ncbi:MAG: JAB domain-containing protein [Arcobacteraceae bacterium]|nr:JAB domain-containing protein [Arcobacteraceae bacterium]
MIDYIGETKINYRKTNTTIRRASDIFKEIEEFKDKVQEHFITIYLNGANEIIESRVITIGTLNQSLVHPREVFSPAIEKRAASIIIAHNHPSGILKPSKEDLQVTKRLRESGKILGIEVLDHIIFGDTGFYSFKDENLL